MEFAKLGPWYPACARAALDTRTTRRAPTLGLRARDMRANAFLALALAAALAPGASGSAAVFASDRRVPYFLHHDASGAHGRVAYETLGASGLARLLDGVLGRPDAADAADLPDWVDADALERAPPDAVLVYRGARPATPADLAHPDVAQRLKRALDRAGSTVTAPHAALDLDPSRVDTDVVSLAARALADPAARRFVAGACDVDDVARPESIQRLHPADPAEDLARRLATHPHVAGTIPDVIVVCASSDPSASFAEDVDAFDVFVETLRLANAAHVAVLVGGSEPSTTSGLDSAARAAAETNCVDAIEAETKGRRALLQTSGDGEEEGYVCDALCALQTNIVSALVFFWTLVLAILFGYAMMHNLDTPTRFEKSKEESER